MSKSIDELPEGGMGIKIISELADELSYIRASDDKNCLSTVKNYEQQSLEQSQALQKIHLQVNTDLRALDQVLDWYEQLENLPIPQTVFQQCQLVLAEGFTNAVRHAHQGLPSETPIELEISVFDESLEMRVWDYGQSFDLEAKLSELRESELRESDLDPLESEGGRGLIFMLKLADRVTYTRASDRRNCLVIVKRLPPSSTL